MLLFNWLSLFARAYNSCWVQIPIRGWTIRIVRPCTTNYKERGMVVNGNIRQVKGICFAIELEMSSNQYVAEKRRSCHCMDLWMLVCSGFGLSWHLYGYVSTTTAWATFDCVIRLQHTWVGSNTHPIIWGQGATGTICFIHISWSWT